MTDSTMLFVMTIAGIGLVIALTLALQTILHEDDLKDR